MKRLQALIVVFCMVVVATLPCHSFASENQCASFDFGTGILNIPCFELGGYFYWLNLSLVPSETALLFQLTNFGSDCQDDDVINRVYRGCNYFPLQTGNTWFYKAGDFVKTVTVSSDSYSFGNCTGKRISYLGEPCTEDDYFLTYSSKGIELCGEYDRDDMQYKGTLSGFPLLPKDMKVGDVWSVTAGGGTTKFQLISAETLTVSGMKFESVLKVKMERVSQEGSWANYIWFAKNVGMVKIQRIYEKPLGHKGCAFTDSEHPLMELRNAYVKGISYP